MVINPYVRQTRAAYRPVRPVLDCPKCHCDHVHMGRATCVAHRSRMTPMTPCHNIPKTGFAVCYLHGARSPQAIAAAEDRLLIGMIRSEALKALAGLRATW